MTQAGTLYKLNFPNGKSYIGITTRGIEARFAGHLSAAKSGSDLPLTRAIRKHGAPDKQILAFMNHDDLPAAEIRAIRVFGTLTPNGYNVTFGGQTSPTLRPEVAAKMGRSHLGMRPSEETLEKLSAWQRGKPKSAKHRAALKEAKRLKPFTAEVRARMSASHLGVPLSATTRERMSIAGRGRPKSVEHKAKIGASNRGKILSPETRAKISAAQQGKKSGPHTKETRAKMVIAWDLRRKKTAMRNAVVGGVS